MVGTVETRGSVGNAERAEGVRREASGIRRTEGWDGGRCGWGVWFRDLDMEHDVVVSILIHNALSSV